jgi:putative Holliday junction resolvase
MTTAENRTILAIDYGRRRVGLAKTDPLGLIPSALATLEVRSMADAVTRIATVIAEHQPAVLVVGYPLLASGDRGDMCREIDRFLDQLAPHWPGPIHRVDEYASSSDAAAVVHAHGKRIGKQKGRLDRLAAVLILQRFLDEPPTR